MHTKFKINRQRNANKESDLRFTDIGQDIIVQLRSEAYHLLPPVLPVFYHHHRGPIVSGDTPKSALEATANEWRE